MLVWLYICNWINDLYIESLAIFLLSLSSYQCYLDSVINIIWLTGLLLLILSLIEGFLGYILLWGQMSYWGITVILNVLSIIAYFGPIIISNY